MSKINAPIRAARKAANREKLLTAARAVWAEPGSYEAGTIRVISKAAGLSTGAFFANWPSKEALWLEVMGYPAPRDCPEVRHLLSAMHGQTVAEAA